LIRGNNQATTPPIRPWDPPDLNYNYLGDATTRPQSNGRWAVLDGPEAPTYTPTVIGTSTTEGQQIIYNSSKLKDAYNPLRADMKYRVVSFKYDTD
jgi:hypothetical protein